MCDKCEDPNGQWIGILSDADASVADATVRMVQRETLVGYTSRGGTFLTFGPVTGT